MENRGKKKWNPAMIVLVIFAVIGVIAVVTLGVKFVVGIVDKASDKVAAKEVVLDTADDKILTSDIDSIEFKSDEKKNENQSSDNQNSDKKDLVMSGESVSEPLPEVFSEVAIPMPEAVGEVEEVDENRKLQIVFLGDSVLDNFRDETGIAYRTGAILDANVYNLGIAGVCASLNTENSWYDETWDSTSGLGVAKILAGKVSPDALYDCRAKEMLKENKDVFKNTDIFVIEYGINDFMYGRNLENPDMLSDPRTYTGALTQIMSTLTEAFPDAKFVMCQPSYLEFFRANGEYVGNTYTLNNGPGTEYNYCEKMELVANQFGAYLFTFDDNGITMYNAAETLLDGVHPNEYGRQIYSDNLSQFIIDNVLEDIEK